MRKLAIRRDACGSRVSLWNQLIRGTALCSGDLKVSRSGRSFDKLRTGWIRAKRGRKPARVRVRPCGDLVDNYRRMPNATITVDAGLKERLADLADQTGQRVDEFVEALLRRILYKIRPIEFIEQRGVRIALRPSSNVLNGWEAICLVPVARCVSQHEVVTQIERVPGPGDEMVDCRGGRQPSSAIEAPLLARPGEIRLLLPAPVRIAAADAMAKADAASRLFSEVFVGASRRPRHRPQGSSPPSSPQNQILRSQPPRVLSASSRSSS